MIIHLTHTCTISHIVIIGYLFHFQQRTDNKLESSDRIKIRFYHLDEKKLKMKEDELRDREQKLRIEKKKGLVLRHIQRELENLKKRNEISHRKLKKVLNQHDQSRGDSRGSSYIIRSELSGKLRSLQLRRMDVNERIRTLTEVN